MVSTCAVGARQSNGERCELPPLRGLLIRVLDDPRVVERIRVLDDYCLLVKYPSSYYDTYVRPCAHHFNQIALYHDILVGSCTCRLEVTEEEGVYRLYVMTIAVLAPYRRLGIGSRLLQSVLDKVRKETRVRVSVVALHVQVGSSAFEFYKSFGFTVGTRVERYYEGLDECDALLLQKVVPQPHFENANAQQKQAKSAAKGGKKK